MDHVINGQGVAADNSKIQAVLDWPIPTTITGLRGFLGLAGFYRRFIRNFGVLAAPLTSLLRRNSLSWSNEAHKAFDELKLP